jgi:hypothetical protein
MVGAAGLELEGLYGVLCVFFRKMCDDGSTVYVDHREGGGRGARVNAINSCVQVDDDRGATCVISINPLALCRERRLDTTVEEEDASTLSHCRLARQNIRHTERILFASVHRPRRCIVDTDLC